MNCSLKSANNMFQCLKNIIVCLIFKKLKTRYKFNIYYLTREKKSAYFTVALILLPLFLLFPFSTLKLLIPSSLSNTKPTPSHSSSPSTQTKIQGWASFSFGSHLHCLQSKTQQQRGICLLPKPGEKGAISTPKTHRLATNPGLKNTLTLVVNGFLSKDCCFPSLYF